MNAVYTYFVAHGYFEEAWAKRAAEAPGAPGAEAGRETCLLYEKGAVTFESNCWAFHSGACRSPACFCYNIIRYALTSRFGMDLELLKSDLKPERREAWIWIALVPVRPETIRRMELLEALRKQEAELKKVTDAYRRTVEMSLDAIVSADASGRIVLWNPAAERMFGYTREEALGMPLSALMPEAYRERHQEGFRRFLETEKPVLIGNTVEVEGLRKDGSRFPKEISLAAAKVEGRWIFTAVMRDITERKQLENRLREKLREVERLNKLMVGRELKMEALRKELEVLRARVRALEG